MHWKLDIYALVNDNCIFSLVQVIRYIKNNIYSIKQNLFVLTLSTFVADIHTCIDKQEYVTQLNFTT